MSRRFSSGRFSSGHASGSGSGSERWRIALDALLFMRQRIDYYQYLGDLLRDMKGFRTLKEVFLLDAERYGDHTVRGRLSRHWYTRYQQSGGDLQATWSGTLPEHELSVLRSAQTQGNEAVIAALGELADALKLMDTLRGVLSSTLMVAGAAVVLVLGMLLAVPFFTVPRLMQAFVALPPDYYGGLTRSLLSTASWLEQFMLPVSMGVVGLFVAVLWSIPNLVGPLRAYLDPVGVWKIYRALQGIRFLVLLGILLRKDTQGPVQLRTALLLVQSGTGVWLSHHIDQMRALQNRGAAGTDAFDTGIFEAGVYWFLQDMVAARGLRQGLGLTADRLRVHVLERVRLHAALMRWLLLLASVVILIALALWHYAVIDELRRALMIFYASR
ncbi:MAG: general secretion pathway protein [Alcaligenaceae bacterium]|nr:general secretion pathway protein [Alcaligenaceae bacterium]